MRCLLSLLLLTALPAAAQVVTPGPRTNEGPTNYCENGSGTDAYSCTITGLQSYIPGNCYHMYTAIANTGTASVNFGAGVKTITRVDGSTLQGDGNGPDSDDIPANHVFHVCYVQATDQMELMGITVASAGTQPYFQLFTTANPWTVSGSTHGLGANVEVFTDSKNGTTSWDKIAPASLTVDQTSGDVVVNWASARSGRIKITQLAGASQGPSAPTDHSALTNLGLAQSGHPTTGSNGFASAVHHATHQNGGTDEIATATPAANALPKADGSGNLTSWIADLVGDSGSGGSHGLVPAPATGDASKCLKGDGTWGSCATGVAGVSSFVGRTGAVVGADADYNASQVVVTPSGTISSTRVSTALAEVAADSVAITSKDAPNGVAALDSGSKITRSVMPIMVGDSGSGGSAGAVPAPGTGDSSNCLRGDASWGPCGSGGGSGGIDIYDEGGSPTLGATKLNFIGSGVTAVYNSGATRVDVTIPGGGGGGGGTCDTSGGFVCATGDVPSIVGNISYGAGNLDYTISLPNNAVTGPTIYKLVQGTTSNPMTATIAQTSTHQALGICTANCTTSGSARITMRGQALCVFDSPPSAVGKWVVVGTNGNCLEASGTARPTDMVGQVYSTTAEAGKYRVIVMGF